ncbi:hypothetical protein NQZ79_g8413 [Umbelopsis isabellina]|nr:hypothetical protein NQZ79_g8413 [Umbelopsis isabellina]
MPLPVPKAANTEPGVLPTGDAYHKLHEFLQDHRAAQQISIDDDHYQKGLVCAVNDDGKRNAVVLDIDRQGISSYLRQAGYEQTGKVPDSTAEIFKRQTSE